MGQQTSGQVLEWGARGGDSGNQGKLDLWAYSGQAPTHADHKSLYPYFGHPVRLSRVFPGFLGDQRVSGL